MKTSRPGLSNQEIRRYTIRFWKLLIGITALGMFFILSIGLGLFGKLPSFRDLENPKSNLASEVISVDGEILGTYFLQNRSIVNFKQLSPDLVNALISTEDVRFYDHSGIDFKRSVTILIHNLNGRKQGASTITQQLAKNMFPRAEMDNFFSIVVIKLKEWIMAIMLERYYTKEEIISMYFNTVDFGNNAFGIKAAAHIYFNTTPAKLNASQSALLVGMLKGPSRYSPTRNPERALARRNIVIGNMAKEGFLGGAEAEQIKKQDLNLHFQPISYGEGSAAYFRAVLKKDLQRILKEQSIEKPDGTPYDLDRDGLRIYTTINTKMQRYAEEAQREYLKTLQNQFNQQWKGKDPFGGSGDLITLGLKRSDRYKQLKQEGLSNEEIWANFRKKTSMTIFSWKGNIDTVMRPIDSIKYYKTMLRNAVMSMEPQTGYIRAWVGGIDFDYFKYDQVKMGTRQVGSIAKPFTYAVAVHNGFSPCYQVLNAPVVLDAGNGKPYIPKQDKPLQGYLTLKKALAHSQNYVAAFIMKQVGPDAVASLTQKMGITSKIPAVPSIFIGSYEASLYDMVGAYSTFVNHGTWKEPTYLLRIEDKKGNVLYEKPTKVVQALDPQTAYAITEMLKGVVQGGTASRLQWRYNLKNPIGGKTGTSQNNSDGWFIGTTPELVTGVWTGCEDRGIHFATTEYGSGTNTALPVFGLYMQKVYSDKTLKYTKGDFEPPKGGSTITLNCDAYNQRLAVRDSTAAADTAEAN